jgi:hypothetical protein
MRRFLEQCDRTVVSTESLKMPELAVHLQLECHLWINTGGQQLEYPCESLPGIPHRGAAPNGRYCLPDESGAASLCLASLCCSSCPAMPGEPVQCAGHDVKMAHSHTGIVWV